MVRVWVGAVEIFLIFVVALLLGMVNALLKPVDTTSFVGAAQTSATKKGRDP